MNELLCLIYVSTATGAMGPKDLADILEKSTTLNQRDDVHGMLLLSEGKFMQCIEGEAPSVERTFARIATSRLHHRVIEMIRSPVAQRRFNNWDWAFQIGPLREYANPGIEEFLETPRQDLPVVWKKRALEQKILREFWDTTANARRIW
jgi:hypothetical protein